MSQGRQTMDQEKVSFNLARLKKGGQNFEIAVDADLAIDLRNGKDIDIRDVVRSEHIFSDVKKGTLAPENLVRQTFGTEEPLEAARKIISEGEIQLTQEHRNKLREEKRRKIVDTIRRNAIDPKTNLPHPPQRIENAMEEAKIHIDEFKPADEQVEGIVKKLRPVLPLSFETKRLSVRLPPEHAGRAYGAVSDFAKPQKESWNNDGSYSCEIEIPAGLEADFYEKINGLTHGTAETKEIGK
ncbi:MAG: ribosome assembly factor SBDS [Candidatus Woesearchaeota archaeon]